MKKKLYKPCGSTACTGSHMSNIWQGLSILFPLIGLFTCILNLLYIQIDINLQIVTSLYFSLFSYFITTFVIRWGEHFAT